MNIIIIVVVVACFLVIFLDERASKMRDIRGKKELEKMNKEIEERRKRGERMDSDEGFEVVGLTLQDLTEEEERNEAAILELLGRRKAINEEKDRLNSR